MDNITLETYLKITKIGDADLQRKAGMKLEEPLRGALLRMWLARDVEHGKLEPARIEAEELGRALTTEETLTILICWIREDGLFACAIDQAKQSPEPMRTALLSGILDWCITYEKMDAARVVADLLLEDTGSAEAS